MADKAGIILPKPKAQLQVKSIILAIILFLKPTLPPLIVGDI